MWLPTQVQGSQLTRRRVGYGMSFWTGPAGDFYGWRVSVLLQLIPALMFAAGLPFTPES